MRERLGIWAAKVENCSERIALDDKTLKVKYPKLVMGCVTGCGEEGPDKDLPGFDFTAFAAWGGILGTLMNKKRHPPATAALCATAPIMFRNIPLPEYG